MAKDHEGYKEGATVLFHVHLGQFGHAQLLLALLIDLHPFQYLEAGNTYRDLTSRWYVIMKTSFKPHSAAHINI